MRRAEPLRLQRWHFLAALGALLFVRAIFYGQIGPAVNWTPKLDLTVVAPAFPLTVRGRVFFLSVLLFSILSFVRVLAVFYLWLLAVAVINKRVTSPDPLQKLVLLQLGRAARWPVVVQLVAPALIIAALWMLFHPLLTHIGVTSAVRSNLVLLAQGLVIGLSAYLSLKFLLAAFLLAHVIVNYVYLGANPVWDFIGTTSRNILSPLNRLPLRFGKVDLAPIIGIVLIALLLFVLPNYLLQELNRRNLTVWPQ